MIQLLSLLVAVQAALSDADRADGRCAVSMSAAAEASTGKERAVLEAGMMFYMGQISGRSGPAAVKPALMAGAEAMEGASPEELAVECAGKLEAITKRF